jgi:prepilin-type N-terminal cleavage/methylation domain-containing protein
MIQFCMNRRIRPRLTRGVTLIEMLIVVALIGLLAGITFPSVSAGLDSLRLTSAGNSLVDFLNAALTRAERRQQVVEVTISKKENALWLHSTEPGFVRKLELPDGIAIVSVLPRPPQPEEGPRQFYLYPGGALPSLGVEIVNRRGDHRVVSVDPITGVPRIQRVEAQ